MSATDADRERHGRLGHRRRRADVLIDGETIAAVGRAGVLRRGRADAEKVIDATRQVRDPRRHRRAHPHGAAVRRHVRLGHVRDRHARRGVGRRHHDRRHGRAAHRRERAGGPRRVAPQGRRQLRDRLRLPPDHRRGRRRVAEGDPLPHRARGRHELQAVHGLPRRVLQRRRPDPAGDADGRRVRRDDHDARRERHRDRRAGRPGARARRHRPAVPRRHAALRPGGRGDPPRDRAREGRRQRAALRRAHVGRRRARGDRGGAARGPERVRRDLPAVPVAHARGDAAAPGLRGREVGLLDAVALAERRAPPPGRPVARACA